MPLFIRSVLTGCIVKKHDPAITFYSRGSNDASARRYIEAFYNLYFFLEYLYGKGKSSKHKALEAFMSSKELTSAINKTISNGLVDQIVSESFLSKINTSSLEDILLHLIKTRGSLHHPNYHRQTWSPGKQRAFANEAVFLQFVCTDVAFKRFMPNTFTPIIEKAYKKVERCLRRGGEIRVVTR